MSSELDVQKKEKKGEKRGIKGGNTRKKGRKGGITCLLTWTFKSFNFQDLKFAFKSHIKRQNEKRQFDNECPTYCVQFSFNNPYEDWTLYMGHLVLRHFLPRRDESSGFHPSYTLYSDTF